MALHPSRRIMGLNQSDIRHMSRECERAGGINLGQGLCDLPTPPAVRDGAIAAIVQGKSAYSRSEGIVELRDAIAAKVARDNGLTVDPETEIVVTVGATGAYTSALHALLDPGDGILLLEPYYGYHLNAAVLAGLEPHFMQLTGPENAFTEAAFLAALRPNTRAVVICTPANPSGKMFTREELETLDRLASTFRLLVITDEIYEYIRYDGRPHISPASVGGLRERCVSIMGMSKTFSITGWRLGYAIAPAPLARSIALVNDIYYVCAPTPLMYGAAAGYRADASYFTDLAAQYQRKRDMVCAALTDVGMKPRVPQGAYYVLADTTDLGLGKGREAAMALLRRTGVAAISGSAFFEGGRGDQLLRFCFAKEDSVLEEACTRLRKLARG